MDNKRLIIDLVRSAAEYESKVRIVEVKNGSHCCQHRAVPYHQDRSNGHAAIQEKERSVIEYR